MKLPAQKKYAGSLGRRAGTAGWQGRRPGGHDARRRAGAAWLHRDHRGLQRIFGKAGKFPEGMWEQELEALKEVEKKTGKKFGDPNNPLLVSCRSGAKFSMPGMMDTVLNIGLTDKTAEGMIKLTGNPRFVYDSYRRLVEMFGTVVLGIAMKPSKHPMAEYKAKKGYKLDTEMTADDWKELVASLQAVVKKEKGFDFPQDPYKQLELATEAVFKSWNGKRAVDYRRATKIPDDLGTAVNIVTMVFGNMGDDSGTGVAFTRNPSTGDKKMMGEYLLNAQGEDVVAGIRNADPIENLQNSMPEVYQPVHGDHRQAGKALQGDAGCRVHHRTRQTVDAADPQRQAHRQGRRQDRRGYGERRPDHQGRGRAARYP